MKFYAKVLLDSRDTQVVGQYQYHNLTSPTLILVLVCKARRRLRSLDSDSYAGLDLLLLVLGAVRVHCCVDFAKNPGRVPSNYVEIRNVLIQGQRDSALSGEGA